MQIVTGKVQYKPIRRIGTGQGMNSEVFLVEDLNTNRTLVAKEIPKTLIQQQFLSDYFTEAKTMAGAGDSANVVPILYACDLNDRIGIVMPHYKGGSLLDKIDSEPLTVLETIKICQGVLNGLSKIHQAGVVHFDIKPSNVLFSNNNTPMVADFGQARAVKRSGTVDLPPLYPDGLPPEYFDPAAIGTIQTDIYHTGLLLYRTVNGDPFFKRQLPTTDLEFETKTLAGKLPDRGAFLPHVSRSLRMVIRKAMAVLPQDRYQSAAALSDALSKISIKHHWSIEIEPNGKISWECHPAGKAKLLIELTGHAGKNAVRCYAIGAKKVARNKGDWRDGLTHPQAMKHLTQVFATLG